MRKGLIMITKEYSLEELKTILFHKLYNLIGIEPYWEKCMNCPNHGKCCIGADISIREDEWTTIKQYLVNLRDSDKEILLNNISNNVLCPFRAADKCIIHEVRPMNCIWTPFQAAQNVNNGNIMYSIIDSECESKLVTLENQEFVNHNMEYIKLPGCDRKRYYLFLNNFIINYANSSNCSYKNLSELINQVPSLIC